MELDEPTLTSEALAWLNNFRKKIAKRKQTLALLNRHRRKYLYTRYNHPGDPRHVLRVYRRHILSLKKKYGSARAIMHYNAFVQTYLAAKRMVNTGNIMQRAIENPILL